jgi:hypothetical protein
MRDVSERQVHGLQQAFEKRDDHPRQQHRHGRGQMHTERVVVYPQAHRVVRVVVRLGVGTDDRGPGGVRRGGQQHHRSGIAEQRMHNRLFGCGFLSDVQRAELDAAGECEFLRPGGDGVQRHLDGVEGGVAPHVPHEGAAQVVAQPEFLGQRHLRARVRVAGAARHDEGADAVPVHAGEDRRHQLPAQLQGVLLPGAHPFPDQGIAALRKLARVPGDVPPAHLALG